MATEEPWRESSRFRIRKAEFTGLYIVRNPVRPGAPLGVGWGHQKTGEHAPAC